MESFSTDEELRNNYFHIYHEPHPSREVFITADVAEGLNSLGKHDFSVASVWDMNTWEQLAQIHGHWPTSYFAQMLMELGYLYDPRGCALIVERNNQYGGAVLEKIENNSDYPIGPNGLYVHEDEKIGWPTNLRTRPLMLEAGKELFEDGSMKVNSLRTLEEMFAFVKKENRKVEAVGGSFDDCVIEFCMAAIYLWSCVPKYVEPVSGGQEKWYPINAGVQRTYKPVGYLGEFGQ
jgi:hypothetical protein